MVGRLDGVWGSVLLVGLVDGAPRRRGGRRRPKLGFCLDRCDGSGGLFPRVLRVLAANPRATPSMPSSSVKRDTLRKNIRGKPSHRIAIVQSSIGLCQLC